MVGTCSVIPDGLNKKHGIAKAAIANIIKQEVYMSDPKRTRGKLKMIRVDSYGKDGKCYFRIENETDKVPKDELFYIDKDSANYNASYSMLLIAFANRYQLVIGALKPITDQGWAEVGTLIINHD